MLKKGEFTRNAMEKFVCQTGEFVFLTSAHKILSKLCFQVENGCDLHFIFTLMIKRWISDNTLQKLQIMLRHTTKAPKSFHSDCLTQKWVPLSFQKVCAVEVVTFDRNSSNSLHTFLYVITRLTSWSRDHGQDVRKGGDSKNFGSTVIINR